MNMNDYKKLMRRYVIGFVVALVLSTVAYTVVVLDVFPSAAIAMEVLLGLAVAQLIVQLIFFLHLDVKGRSAGRTVAFVFTAAMMLIIVIGSIWIMRNLDYRMNMSSEAMNDYMYEQNKKGF